MQKVYAYKWRGNHNIDGVFRSVEARNNAVKGMFVGKWREIYHKYEDFVATRFEFVEYILEG